MAGTGNRLERVSSLVTKGHAPSLVLVRHGSTSFNHKHSGHESAERIRGWANIPLDEEGAQEADKMAARMVDDPIDVVYSSDLERARVTAHTIAHANKAQPRLEVRMELRPWNLGDFTGKPVTEVIDEMRRLVKEETEAPPGGEPFATFRQRALGFLSGLLDQVRQQGAFLVAVTHTRVTQVARAWVAKGAPADLSIDFETMDDYSDEVATGRDMVLKPSPSGVSLGTPE